MSKTKTLTPERLLSTWELKDYVDKHSPEYLKPHFEIAFKRNHDLQKQELRISSLCVRNNIQMMLDNLNDKDMIIIFKEIYPRINCDL